MSVDAPTSGPVGDALTVRAFDEIFEDVARAGISYWFERASMPVTVPRLETVLSVGRGFVGDSGLDWLLADLHTAEPNDLHRFCAAHLRAGGSHITANVDRCIEKSLPSGSWPESALIHFHGAIDERGSTAGLGLVLNVIEGGFPAETHDALTAALTSDTHTSIVFIGYSGSDYFDVTPFLQGLPHQSLSGKQAIWMQYTADPVLREGRAEELDGNARTVLDALAKAGAETGIILGPPRALLSELAERWNLPAVPLTPPTRRASPQPIRRRPTAWNSKLRQTATVDLYARLGLPNLLLSYVTVHPEIDEARVAVEIGEAHRTSGDPKASLEWAVRAWPGATANDVARRGEKHVQALRGAGHIREARHKALQLAAWAARKRDLLDGTSRLLCIDVTTGVLYDQYRTPLGRLLPHRRRAANLLAELHLLAPTVDLDLGLRVRRVERDLQAMLGQPRTSDLDDSAVPLHQQSSSVIRSLNYRQGQLRTPTGDQSDDKNKFQELHGIWMEMGQFAEIARMMTSPLAIPTLQVPRVLANLCEAARRGKWTRRTATRLVILSLLASVTRRRG